jgi:hypothetical protein
MVLLVDIYDGLKICFDRLTTVPHLAMCERTTVRPGTIIECFIISTFGDQQVSWVHTNANGI